LKSLKLNTSYKHHIIVGLLLGLWLSIFLIVIAPFDASDLSFKIRLILLPAYGLIFFLSYNILIPLQNYLFKVLKRWHIGLEFSFVFMFTLVAMVSSFLYYRSDIINGDYKLFDFIVGIYFPIFFVLLPIIIIARWFINRKVNYLKSNKITLKGENKLDVLHLELHDLICISSADNYVEVHYLDNGLLSKKLLRTTLKSSHLNVPSLLKVHRSHLINPLHFKDWKNASTLQLTQLEIPVSKKYKKDVLALNHSSLKLDDSPQNTMNASS